MTRLIEIEEARRLLFAHIRAGPQVEIGLSDALHRTLAAPVVSDLDQPPFDRSVMDGYAVRSNDVARAPINLRVVDRVAAGAIAAQELGPGQSMQINTGAAIPTGADAVVRVEETVADSSGKTVQIQSPVERGKFITPRATYVSAGQCVLDAGVLMTPVRIAAAAAAGANRVTVYRRPTVAVLATGDELVDIGEKPVGAQIRNSNQYELEALIRTAHAEPVMLGTARDDRAELRERIEAGLDCDVLCVTGGVSMGTHDYVPEVLRACGAEFHIQKIAIKPGRPTIFAATPGGTLIFALPGNPVSMLIGFELLVRPALGALEGRSGTEPVMQTATLRGEIGATGPRRSFIPASASVDQHGLWMVTPVSWGGSGDTIGPAAANALIVRPPDSERAEGGAAVFFMSLDPSGMV